MSARLLALAVLVACALAPARVRADVVFRDPNLHCPRGAIVEPTHGPSYCMPLPCDAVGGCPAYQFDDHQPGDCVPVGVCVVTETVPGGGRAPPGTTYTREVAVANCDATTPCANGECRQGGHCVPHGTGNAPPPPPPPVTPPPFVPPPAPTADASGFGATAMTGGLAGACGGAVAGSIVALFIALVVSRRRRSSPS